MTSYTLVIGDLLEADTEYIVQQNCCTATRVHGLSEIIAKKWPAINPYIIRKPLRGNWAVAEDRPEPGTIMVFPLASTDSKNGIKGVICAFGQYCHGKPNVYKDPLGLDSKDSRVDREEYFKQCLEAISKITPTPKSVGFPFKIGSNLAGGSWIHYERMIRVWAESHPEITVKIYRLPTEK
jgi:hypothetical protein